MSVHMWTFPLSLPGLGQTQRIYRKVGSWWLSVVKAHLNAFGSALENMDPLPNQHFLHPPAKLASLLSKAVLLTDRLKGVPGLILLRRCWAEHEWIHVLTRPEWWCTGWGLALFKWMRQLKAVAQVNGKKISYLCWWCKSTKWPFLQENPLGIQQKH